jgi:hypothetical protein
MEGKEIKLPEAFIYSTAGLVSGLQLVDTTSGDIFAPVRGDTSEVEMQRILYIPAEIPENEDHPACNPA